MGGAQAGEGEVNVRTRARGRLSRFCLLLKGRGRTVGCQNLVKVKFGQGLGTARHWYGLQRNSLPSRLCVRIM